MISLFVPYKLSLNAPESERKEKSELDYNAVLLEGKLRMQLGKRRIPQTFLRCMKLNPQCELPYFQFALYLYFKKSLDSSIFIKKGLALMKTTSSCDNLVMLLKGIEAIQKDRNIDTAKVLLEKCAKKYPSCPSTLYELGKIYF